jgi:hypothetical protein
MQKRTLLRRAVLRKVHDGSLEAMALGEVEEGKREEVLLLLIMEMDKGKGMEKAVVNLHRRRRREVDDVKINECSVHSYFFLFL